MSFARNSLTMVAGAAVAQLIPLAISPILTRLYSADAIGLQMLFASWAGILAVCATLRCDLAVVLPADDEEARDIAALVLVSMLVTALVLLLGVVFFGPSLATLSGHAGTVGWLWLLPPMVVAVATQQLAAGFATRQRLFRRMAAANVANQAVYACCAIGIGLGGASLMGLVASRFAGQLVAALVLLSLGLLGVADLLRRVRPARLAAVASRYRQFLVFNTPYSLVGTAARETVIIALSAFGQTAAAGQYGLARMMLIAPGTLVTSALSQVFYREAVALNGKPELGELTFSLLRFGLLAAAPLFAFIAIWGDVAFSLVFGARWEAAGDFARVLAVPAWLSLQTGWPERLFEVARRQDVSFRVQLLCDFVTAGSVITTIALGYPPLHAALVFAVLNVAYHCVYLAAICRVSGFAFANLWRNLGFGASMFAVFAALLAAIRMVTGPTWWSLALAAAIAAGAGLWFARRNWPNALRLGNAGAAP